jgi:putative molybdopterin biosynthesis protein
MPIEAKITNNLAALRKRTGLSAARLAAEVGITRQAIYAIEAGTYIPNTLVSLRLAHVLGVSVDQIFHLQQPEGADDAELLGPPSEATAGAALQLGRVDGRLVAVRPFPQGCYLPPSDATIQSSQPDGRVTVKLHDPASNLDNHLIISGCDPASSILARHLQRVGVDAVLVHSNSLQSLTFLKDKCVHIAGTHLGDASVVRNHLRREPVEIISVASWQEGLVVATGNPKRIRSIEDLARPRIRLVNRESGAATRVLLDNELARLHISPSQIRGYRDEAPGHLAAAFRVKNGTADCCIAIEAAARVFGLAFIPLNTARYDFVIRRRHLQLPAVRTLLDVLNQGSLRRELAATAGYETTITGTTA